MAEGGGQNWREPPPILETVRVVSLLPSATEIVYALGLGDDLVGVTFECDEPPSARREKTVVVGGRDTSAMAPGEIDAYVRAQLAAGADLYTLHADALAALEPDLILTQDLCRVCALPTDHVEDALAYLGCTAEVISLDPHRLDEVLETIRTVGDRTGVSGRAARLVNALRARLAVVAARVEGQPRPSVAVLEWVDPPFTAGHWVPDLVSAAGGTPVAASPAARSLQSSWEAIASAVPDIVLVAPCGFHLDAAARQSEFVVEQLPGVPVWAIDADSLIVRPGPRVVDGVEAIAAILHPGEMPAPPANQVTRVA
jgi:iron complex transport system substrate-binding protein